MKKGQSAFSFEELIWRGVSLGLLLFTSSVIWMSIRGYEDRAIRWFPYLPEIAGIYILAGLGLMYLYFMPRKENKWFTGLALLYWLSIAFTIFCVAAAVIPPTVKELINVNAAVLLILWLGNYVSLRRIAKELNGGKAMKRRVLLVDLRERPAGTEGFLQALEEYCRKNHKRLEYVERGMPALIRLNGVLHRVELSFYYSYGGAIYTLKFTQLPEREERQ